MFKIEEEFGDICDECIREHGYVFCTSCCYYVPIWFMYAGTDECKFCERLGEIKYLQEFLGVIEFLGEIHQIFSKF